MGKKHIEIFRENNHLEVDWADEGAVESEYSDTFYIDEGLASILVGINKTWRNSQDTLRSIYYHNKYVHKEE